MKEQGGGGCVGIVANTGLDDIERAERCCPKSVDTMGGYLLRGG